MGGALATAVIHFGLAKTGTTYLQEYLACNREELLQKYGILYPSGDANHFHFQTILSDAPETLIQVRRLGIEAKGKAQEFVNRFRDNFEAEVRSAKPETILISSEYFSSMSEVEFPRLKNFFAQYSAHHRAIVYMRDPWSHSVSAMQQNIRDGLLGAPLKLGYRKGQFRMIERIEGQFGQDMIVRPYLSGAGVRTNIVEDFSKLIGIDDLPNRPADSGSDNTGVGRTRATMLAELNKIWPQFDASGLYIYAPERDLLVARILELDIEDMPLRLSKRYATVIRQLADEDLAYIHHRFFDGEPVFLDHFSRQSFEDFDAEIKFETLPSETLSQIARLVLAELAGHR